MQQLPQHLCHEPAINRRTRQLSLDRARELGKTPRSNKATRDVALRVDQDAGWSEANLKAVVVFAIVVDRDRPGDAEVADRARDVRYVGLKQELGRVDTDELEGGAAEGPRQHREVPQERLRVVVAKGPEVDHYDLARQVTKVLVAHVEPVRRLDVRSLCDRLCCGLRSGRKRIQREGS